MEILHLVAASLYFALIIKMVIKSYRKKREETCCKERCCFKQWIPIKEGPPKEEGYYLCWAQKSGEEGATGLFCSVDEEGKPYFLIPNEDLVVTHWAYAPDPPAEVEKK